MDNRGGGAVAFGLLCLLAATWATASGDSLMQDRFKVDGSPDYLRGTFIMNRLDYSGFKILIPIEAHLKGNESLGRQNQIFESILETHGEIGGIREQILALLDFPKCCSCSEVQMRFFLFLNQVGQTLTPAELALKRYVNYFALDKFKQCAEESKVENPEKSLGEFEFDLFYKKLFRLPDGADDGELYSRVKDINLLEDELEFDRTLPMLIKWTGKPAKDALDLAASFFADCRLMPITPDIDYYYYYSSIIFANALGLTSETDPRRQKLIEYDHICWYVSRRKEQLYENIKRQLERAQKRDSLFNKFAGCLGAICDRD
jgi:hypothetical protein